MPPLSPDAATLLKTTMHGLPKDKLPRIEFPDAVLSASEEINLADLLDSSAFGPYTMVNLNNASRRLHLFDKPDADELELINDVQALLDQCPRYLFRECGDHVRDCGQVIRHPNLRHPAFRVHLQDLRR